MIQKVKLQTVLLVISLVHVAKSDCLSNQTLVDLGLGSLNQTAYTNSSICASYYNANGGCVNSNGFQTFVKNADSNLKGRIDDGSSFSGVFNNLKNKVRNIFSNQNSTTVNAALDNIKQKALDARNKCLNAVSLIHHGLYCLLSSGAATSGATDNGSVITVRADLNDVGSKLEECLPLIDATCTSFYGNPISDSAVYASNSTVTDLPELSNSTCTSLKAAYSNCPNGACDERKRILIQDVFVSNGIKFIPPKSLLDKVGEAFGKLADWFTNLFKRRLATTPRQIVLVVDVSGQKLALQGQNSGFEVPTTASASFAMTAFIALLLALFV